MWEEECGAQRALRVPGAWRAAGAIAAQVSGNSYAEKDTWYALRCKILQISKKNYRTDLKKQPDIHGCLDEAKTKEINY